MINEVKNLPAKKMPIGRLFSKELQPSSESKKAGWERKKQRQELANTIMKFKNLPIETIFKIKSILLKQRKTKSDIKRLKALLGVTFITIGDYHLLKYAYQEKFLLDWIDRNLEKAPSQIEMISDVLTKVTLTIENKPDE